MDQFQLDEVVRTLREKGALKPCPRCAANNFSIIGESELTVTKQGPQSGGLLGGLASLGGHMMQITMPTVIITCDNCGYVSQHAKASLVKEKSQPVGLGLLGRNRND